MRKAPLQLRKENRQERAWLESLLAQIQNSEFYGKIMITFESGKIRHVIKEQSLKPPVHDS